MNLSQVKKYTTEVLKQWFTNKPVLDKLNETETGELLYGTKTISSNPVLKYQKYLNTELDYCYLKHKLTEDTKLLAGSIVPFIYYNGNMETNENNYSIILKAGKTYKISCDVFSWSAGLTIFNVYDLTNDKIISQLVKAAASYSTGLCNTASEVIYTPENDCEIQIKVEKIEGEQYLRPFNNRSSFIVQEINRQIIIDPVEHVNTEQGLEDTPVGHIISHMGVEAPNHYLICDGTEYNIADYPHLAQHMVDSFGSVNHFGGDGTTTFAVPDLRGEFLRGSGTATRDTGSGGEIGEHQEPTNHQYWYVGEDWLCFYGDVKHDGSYKNIDKPINVNTKGKKIEHAAYTSAATCQYYTSRPTNTSVLYCIKYEPTYYTTVVQNINTDPELQQIIGQLELILDDINGEVV